VFRPPADIGHAASEALLEAYCINNLFLRPTTDVRFSDYCVYFQTSHTSCALRTQIEDETVGI
jgi:hypothetical protein